jgi:hypothetical protein
LVLVEPAKTSAKDFLLENSTRTLVLAGCILGMNVHSTLILNCRVIQATRLHSIASGSP